MAVILDLAVQGAQMLLVLLLALTNSRFLSLVCFALVTVLASWS